MRRCSAAISASNAFFTGVAAPGSLYVGSVRPSPEAEIRRVLVWELRGEAEPCASSRMIAVAAANVSSSRDMTSMLGRYATALRDACGRICWFEQR